MKYLKMLVLAAAAAMTMVAALGTGSAPAAVLCTEWANPCPAAKKHGVGTTLSSSLDAGSSAVFRDTFGNTLLTCTGATMTAKVTNAGGAGVPVTGDIEAVGFTGCGATFGVLKTGVFELHHVGPETNGRTTIKDTKVTLVTLGQSCIYSAGGWTNVGLWTSAKLVESPTQDFSAILFLEEGGLACPAHVIWEAKYVVTMPKPIWLKGA